MIEAPFKKLDWKKTSRIVSSDGSNCNTSSYTKSLLIRVISIFCLIFLITFMIGDFADRKQVFIGNVAFGESADSFTIEPSLSNKDLGPVIAPEIPAIEMPFENLPSSTEDNEEYTVQAVLGANEQIVLSSGLDAKIIKFKLESGDQFKKGDVLVKYDCSVDQARLKELYSRQRITEQQLSAYQKLLTLDSASNIELLIAKENNEQNKALISQIKARLKSCQHVAPWNGRVMRKMASQYEFVQTGRVLMEIASNKPLRAEFLIPSEWLRWVNINTPVNIYISETDKTYEAKITNIFGEVDPVSQSIQVVAEIENYFEELLPGMSGRATFKEKTIEGDISEGFLGLKLSENKIE